MAGKGEESNSSIKWKSPNLFYMSCTIIGIPHLDYKIEAFKYTACDSSMTDSRWLPIKANNIMASVLKQKHAFKYTFPFQAM